MSGQQQTQDTATARDLAARAWAAIVRHQLGLEHRLDVSRLPYHERAAFLDGLAREAAAAARAAERMAASMCANSTATPRPAQAAGESPEAYRPQQTVVTPKMAAWLASYRRPTRATGAGS